MQELAAALSVQLTARLPRAVDRHAARHVLYARVLALVAANEDSRRVGVAAQAHDLRLRLELALAVADDAALLEDLALSSRARHSDSSLARLRSLQQHAHALVVGRKARELSILLILPDVAPQPLARVGLHAGEQQLRRLGHRVPGAAVAAPGAILVECVGGVTVARANALEVVAEVPGAVHRVLDVAASDSGHFERVCSKVYCF